MSLLRQTKVVSALVLLAALPGIAHCQGYPQKPVTFVVPFPAGGSVDFVARLLGKSIGDSLGQPVVVMNRPGAGGNIGAGSVAQSAPDGYTLLIGSTALAISPALYDKLSYDVRKDLAPVSQLVVTPNVLVVHPSLPAKSVKELIALAKSRPDQLHSASAGTGSSNHLALVLFNTMAELKIAHVPYKGASPAVTDVVAGQVDMTFVPMPAAVPLINAGRLRALAVTTDKRSNTLPRLPTIAEAGVPGYEAASWTGMLAPAGTPQPVIKRVHEATVEALNAGSVKDALAKAGAEPVGNTPGEFASILVSEIDKWGKVIKAAGIKSN